MFNFGAKICGLLKWIKLSVIPFKDDDEDICASNIAIMQ